MDMKKIGENFARLRKSNSYTQESLAEKFNISPQAVSKWETGICLPETSVLIELADLYGTSVDEIIRPDKPKKIIAGFVERNLAIPDSKILNWIPRISRWNAPQGCDMWYSFPAMIATALVCVEAGEQNRTEITYPELNERFRDLIHITGMGYGFLWNTVSRHLIEELWHVGNIAEMVAQVMGYYGRDYLFLTPDNATMEETRRIIMWSVAQGRPVVAEWLGGLPEFSIIAGYENNGETLTGYTYCEECASRMNEHGMFVNPARWNELGDGGKCHVLVIGNKIRQTVSDRDTIGYALSMLNKNDAGNKDHFLSHELIAGDATLRAWLDACDTDENTLQLFSNSDLFTGSLNINAVLPQECIFSFYKKLGERSVKRANDIIIQIGISVTLLKNDNERVRKLVSEKSGSISEIAAECRKHIEFLIDRRENMRNWLNELIELV